MTQFFCKLKTAPNVACHFFKKCLFRGNVTSKTSSSTYPTRVRKHLLNTGCVLGAGPSEPLGDPFSLFELTTAPVYRFPGRLLPRPDESVALNYPDSFYWNTYYNFPHPNMPPSRGGFPHNPSTPYDCDKIVTLSPSIFLIHCLEWWLPSFSSKVPYTAGLGLIHGNPAEAIMHLQTKEYLAQCVQMLSDFWFPLSSFFPKRCALDAAQSRSYARISFVKPKAHYLFKFS